MKTVSSGKIIIVENTGFSANPERSEGTYSKYASLDDKTDGFTTMCDILNLVWVVVLDTAHEIRDGHLSREEGVALLKSVKESFQKIFGEFLYILVYLKMSFGQ